MYQYTETVVLYIQYSTVTVIFAYVFFIVKHPHGQQTKNTALQTSINNPRIQIIVRKMINKCIPLFVYLFFIK